jgi:hypothetical protein
MEYSQGMTKDEAAQAMAKKRWANTTAEQRKKIAEDMNAARWGTKKKAGKKKAVKK